SSPLSHPLPLPSGTDATPAALHANNTRHTSDGSGIMSKPVIVEFSPNGVLGRVTSPETITYPGVFLGLPFDVHMPRHVPVYGPDVPEGVPGICVRQMSRGNMSGFRFEEPG